MSATLFNVQQPDRYEGRERKDHLRIVAAFILALILTPMAAAKSLEDRLGIPAPKNAHAAQSVILDIAKAGSRLVAVGEYGYILYSDDNGNTWQQAEVPVQVTLTAVHFPTRLKGWAVGHDAMILHTNDGGESWQVQLDGHSTGEKLLVSAKAWLTELEQQLAEQRGVSDATLAAKLDAADMAVSEAELEIEKGPSRPFLDVWFKNESEGFAVGAYGYFFVTRDGGNNWQDASPRIPNPEFLHLYALTPVTEEKLLLVGEFGLVLRSEDGGLSWSASDTGYDGTFFTALSSPAGESVFIAGLRGTAFHSGDHGTTWRRVTLPTNVTLIGGEINANNELVIAGLAGTVVSGNLNKASFSVAKREDRAALAAATRLGDGTVLVVGTAGIDKMEKGSH